MQALTSMSSTLCSFCRCCICLVGLTLSACVQQESEVAQATAPPQPPSAWKGDGFAWQIAVPEPLHDAEVQAACDQARSTVAEARQRWLETLQSQRHHWAVKWAAPLAANDNGGDEPSGVEHLWVQPLHWSPFRIEGLLINQPLGTLHNGRMQGDLVSFPIEELSDWVYFKDGEMSGEREGGFTIDVLEARYGRPPTTP